MARFLVAATQNVFFPKSKIVPKKAWHQALAKLGELEKISVKRNKGTITALKIRNLSHNGSKKIAILAHPISKKAKFYFDESRISPYLKKGYDVILFDFNGFGESDRIDFYYWKDAKAIIEQFACDTSIKHAILHGVSFGSFHMIRSIQFLPKNSSVVLENTNRSLYDYWKRWFITGNTVKLLEKLKLPSVKDMNVIGVLQELKREDINFLLIACENDNFTPAKEMEDLASYVQGPKKFVTFEKASHLQAPIVDQIRYTELIEDVTR